MRLISGLATRLAGGLALSAALTLGGCASTNPSSSPPVTKIKVTASDLRKSLDTLLREDVVLSAASTNAALGGRNDEYNAAANALDANSQELAAAFSAIYDKATGDSFLDLWRKHNGFIAAYTQALQAGDDARKTRSINDLLTFADDLGAFLETTTHGHVNKAQVADLIRTHVSLLKAAIDAQATKDYAAAYNRERDCEKQVDIVGDTLADAIVDQFPDKF